MESTIKKLFDSIQNKKEYWIRQREIFGEDHYLTLKTLYEIVGMQEAFEIIVGMPFEQYLIKKYYV